MFAPHITIGVVAIVHDRFDRLCRYKRIRHTARETLATQQPKW